MPRKPKRIDVREETGSLSVWDFENSIDAIIEMLRDYEDDDYDCVELEIVDIYNRYSEDTTFSVIGVRKENDKEYEKRMKGLEKDNEKKKKIKREKKERELKEYERLKKKFGDV